MARILEMAQAFDRCSGGAKLASPFIAVMHSWPLQSGNSTIDRHNDTRLNSR
jgi:hypothetical protein